jgi:hypothetical protein
MTSIGVTKCSHYREPDDSNAHEHSKGLSMSTQPGYSHGNEHCTAS